MPAAAGARDGQVVTFYSYKGGVGRSMALANVAVQLVRWGYAVLCIDFDLEAPGLQRYFANWLAKPPQRGVVDLILDSTKGKPVWRDYVSPLRKGGGFALNSDKFDLLAAGTTAQSYSEQLAKLNWPILYEEHNLGAVIENMRLEWKAAYDFILVDSRTGLTDSSGICTVQLPDILVLLSTLNEQGIDGIRFVAEGSATQRNHLSVDRGKLICIPVPSKVESRAEIAVTREWLTRFESELRFAFRSWVDKGVHVEQVLERIAIPYVPLWSFGERLPADEESAGDPGSLSYALETLAALIAHKAANSDILVQNRDSFVALSALPSVGGATEGLGLFRYDVFVSSDRGQSAFAGDIAKALEARKLRVFLASKNIGDSDVDVALRSSQHFVLIAADKDPLRQQHEVTEFLRASLLDTPGDRRLVAVRIDDESPAAFAMLRDFLWIDARKHRAVDVASAVVERLGQSPAPSGKGAQFVLAPATTIALKRPVRYADRAETHGDWVSTRRTHILKPIGSYRLLPYLITNEQFLAFVKAGAYEDDKFWEETSRRARRRFLCRDGKQFGPAFWRSLDIARDRLSHPVTGISYLEASAFARWLNEVKPDARWHWVLPTEDMWEFAARGSSGNAYPWGMEFVAAVCNSAELEVHDTTPVNRFSAGKGPFGTYDLAGNVWEYVDSRYQKSWACVLRGGSFRNNYDEIKSSLRLFGVPRDMRAIDFGFRCAQVPKKSGSKSSGSRAATNRLL